MPYILIYFILYYTILHHTTLHHTTLHYTTLHHTTLHTTPHYTYTTLHHTTVASFIIFRPKHTFYQFSVSYHLFYVFYPSQIYHFLTFLSQIIPISPIQVRYLKYFMTIMEPLTCVPFIIVYATTPSITDDDSFDIQPGPTLLVMHTIYTI